MDSPLVTVKQAIKYHPLDAAKNEIRVLSFENTPGHGPIRLNLEYVSLDDWKPEYLSFREQSSSTSRDFQLSEAWSERLKSTPTTTKREIYDIVTRFTWGDYICLSYVRGNSDDEYTTISVNNVAMTVTKRLEAALEDLRSSFECRIGMKVWVDTLCINQADVLDRNKHVLRVRDIFRNAFAVTAWTKEREDLNFTGLTPPGEYLLLCEEVSSLYGRRTLEELLGVRDRNWGVSDDDDEHLMDLVKDTQVLAFDQSGWVESDDENDFGTGTPHLRHLVILEMCQLLQKEYWSQLWTIQELAVSPMTSSVCWRNTILRLATLQNVGDILLTSVAFDQSLDPRVWNNLKPKLDLLTFTTMWRNLMPEPGDKECVLDGATMRQLKLLVQRAKCLLPHNKVYGVLGLFPSTVSSSLAIDYNKDVAQVMTEFSSAVPGWQFDENGVHQYPTA